MSMWMKSFSSSGSTTINGILFALIVLLVLIGAQSAGALPPEINDAVFRLRSMVGI